MHILFIVGRLLFGGYFIASAFNHFMNLEMMAGYSASKKVPFPKLAVIGTGLLLLSGGLGILLGTCIHWAIAALVLFLVPVTYMMHNFWTTNDPLLKMREQVNFMKNVGLLGACLMFLAIPTPWIYSVHW